MLPGVAGETWGVRSWNEGARSLRKTPPCEPANRLRGDLWQDRVPTVELPVEHVVAAALYLGNDPAAAAVYREHIVAHAVGDEDARGAGVPGRSHEPRRERDHVREEISVCDPQRERVGGPIRETADCQARRIDGVPGERVLQGYVDQGRVRPISPAYEEIPGVLA